MLSTTIAAAFIAIFGMTSIRGQVLDQDDQPIVGAVVRINAAMTKDNVNTSAALHSPDCGKIVVTDEHGQFQFNDVSDELLLSITAGAKEHRGIIKTAIDPTAQEDLEFQLTKREASEDSKLVTAQIVDHRGIPVAGAKITTDRSAQMLSLSRSTLGAATPSTVSDIDGNFWLHVPAPIASVAVKIEASGYATSMSQPLRAGRSNPPIEITAGASLMGRLLAGGEPVAGLTLEMVQQDRSIGNLVTRQQTKTNDDGTFRLDFLPPATEYTLYSQIGQPTDAALPVTLVTTPRSGMLADLGDITAGPASEITVKLVTFGGETIPTGARCYLKQKHASSPDLKTLTSADRGIVAFQGVASEIVELAVLVPGYEVIQSDPFCQLDMNRRLNLNVVGDQTLTIAIKKSQ